MPTITKLYTIKEASMHTTIDDCWVVVHGKVYDVTKYLDEHPGGDDVLLQAAGKDATEEFEDAGHSKTARELMQDFLVGEIDPSPVIGEMEITKKEELSFLDVKFLNKPLSFWAIPVAVLGVSAITGLLILHKKS